MIYNVLKKNLWYNHETKMSKDVIEFTLYWPSLGMHPTLKCDLFLQWDSLAKTNFSFVDGFQLEIPFGLGIGPMFTFLSFVILSGANQCRSWVWCHILWIHVIYLCPAVFGRCCFHGIIHPLQDLQFFFLFFCRVHKHWVEAFDADTPLRDECRKVSYVRYIVWPPVSVFICYHLFKWESSVMIVTSWFKCITACL